MRLDRIYTQITEAFKAGNKARKKESAVDTIESVKAPSIGVFMNYYKLKSKRSAVIFDKAYNIIEKYEIKTECSTKWECLIMLAAMLADDGISGDFVETIGHRNYEGHNNPYNFSWFDRDILDSFKEILKNDIILKGLFNEMVKICKANDITPREIWTRDFGEGEQDYFSLDEAFKAGNKARKKETAQDAVTDTGGQIPEDLRDLVKHPMLKISMEAALSVCDCDTESLNITGDNAQIVIMFNMKQHTRMPKRNACFIVIYPADKSVLLKGGVLKGIRKYKFGDDPKFSDNICLFANLMMYIEVLCGQREDIEE